MRLGVPAFASFKFPDKHEGDLTAYRAALVNAVTCAEVANELGMNDYLLLSRGEAKDTGRATEKTIYRSRKLETVRNQSSNQTVAKALIAAGTNAASLASSTAMRIWNAKTAFGTGC